MSVVLPGAALGPAAPAPATPRAIAHRGGPANPSAATLAARFPADVVRHEVIWGDTIVWIRAGAARDIVRWLRDDAGERYDYLVDITAVEHRDALRPLEMVWQLRSLPYRRFLRLKAELDPAGALEVPSLVPCYGSADWLEREVFDMFGIRFEGHPDLRRILMWEGYAEGHPLRKDFPLRGRLSRAEQLSRALAANPEARYSMEELTVADAFHELPEEMKRRLAAERRGGGE